jgi:hypothetical protein
MSSEANAVPEFLYIVQLDTTHTAVTVGACADRDSAIELAGQFGPLDVWLWNRHAAAERGYLIGVSLVSLHAGRPFKIERLRELATAHDPAAARPE